ncbi:MAG: putative ABC transporter permease [Bacilli bacterium]|nr:putative ABC transporter permease [Bacilli bacterium]
MNYLLIFLDYFLIFFIYSTLGWIAETIYTSIKEKKFVNRGFLIGPYCPIYGCGSVLMILYLTQYKDNFITVFLLSMLICCFLEYLTSYLMEKIFKARWWDYSDMKYNLNGRICGENALLFGIGGLVIIYIVNPIITKIINLFNPTITIILSIIFFTIFIADTILSFNIINKLKKNINVINTTNDSTQELKSLVSAIISNNIETHKNKLNIFQRRIIKAFPNINLNDLINNNKKSIRNFLKK